MTSQLDKRFWSKVVRRGQDECWHWIARARQRGGYGAFARKHGEIIGAHRMAWELTNGPIPDGLCVLHSCDNPPCCNPAHLFLGTYADNNRDKSSKGRHHAQVDPGLVSGERNPRAKLSEQQVEAIRSRYRAGESQVALAEVFPVSRSMIGQIVRGEAWAA